MIDTKKPRRETTGAYLQCGPWYDYEPAGLEQAMRRRVLPLVLRPPLLVLRQVRGVVRQVRPVRHPVLPVLHHLVHPVRAPVSPAARSLVPRKS